MLKHLGIFAVLVGFLVFAVGASPVGDEAEIPAGMVLIPAGSFEMGSDDEDALGDEQPVHTVHLDAFYMDEYEVTNAQFKAFVDANPEWQKVASNERFHGFRYLHHWNGNTYPSGKANHPVVFVSWYAAMAYAAWAGKRLPTEAEWEYAARGGLEGKRYPWGNTLTHADAHYGGGDTDTIPVGQYAANSYGLYDMTGNVWEWCLDKYDADFYDAHNSRNPISGAVTLQEILDNFASVRIRSFRVQRGGSWVNSARTYLRVAYRGRFSPVGTFDSYGFRCVKAIPR